MTREPDIEAVPRIKGEHPKWGAVKVLSAIGLPGFGRKYAEQLLNRWAMLLAFDPELPVADVHYASERAMRADFACREEASNRAPMAVGSWGVIEPVQSR